MGGATAPLSVTVWLAILTAVVALAGAWGGQWIAARASRRREREQYERDRQREVDRREHEADLHWRDKRLDAYGGLLGGFWAWHAELEKAEEDWYPVVHADFVDGDRRAPLEKFAQTAEPVFARVEDVYNLLARVALVGSPKVIGRAQLVATICGDIAATFRARLALPTVTPDEVEEELVRFEGLKVVRQVGTELRGLQEDIRQELGIPDADGELFPGRGHMSKRWDYLN